MAIHEDIDIKTGNNACDISEANNKAVSCVSLAKVFEFSLISGGHLDGCLILMESKMKVIAMLKRDA
jgi:hypothetical protein